MTPIQQSLARLADGGDLSSDLVTETVRQIMRGDATPAQIGGVLMGLRIKGETVDEIAAAAAVMREFATPVKVQSANLIDTCGTGGDSAGTFNVSTAAAFVAAEAGARVAKHGNRSVSSSSGSADVLEAAGVRLDLTPEQVADCIHGVGLGFMFAPLHHAATRFAVGPRKELALRTMFNLLGPLTNPAGAPSQVMGIFEARWLEPVARVLKKLGGQSVLVVHAKDGLDEISIAAPTDIAELRDGQIRTYTVTPDELGVPVSDLESIRVADAAQSFDLMRSALQGEPGPARDIVALNGGAAIYVSGLVEGLPQGVELAQAILSEGKAWQRLQALVQHTQALPAVESS